MEAALNHVTSVQEKAELFMAKRYIEAMRRKRFTVFARHQVDFDGYRVNYIDNNVTLDLVTVRVEA